MRLLSKCLESWKSGRKENREDKKGIAIVALYVFRNWNFSLHNFKYLLTSAFLRPLPPQRRQTSAMETPPPPLRSADVLNGWSLVKIGYKTKRQIPSKNKAYTTKYTREKTYELQRHLHEIFLGLFSLKPIILGNSHFLTKKGKIDSSGFVKTCESMFNC